MKALLRLELMLVFIIHLLNIYAQNASLLYGSWVKTKMERANGAETAFISKRDSGYIKFTFMNNGKMYLSSIYNELGVENKYSFNGVIIDAIFNKYKIESLDPERLVLTESDQGEFTTNSVKLYFTKEDLYLVNKPISTQDIIISDNDTTYLENLKTYPIFFCNEIGNLNEYLQKFVEGLSNNQEAFLYATFKLSNSGKISNIEIHHHINKTFDNKIYKAIQSTERFWITAKINGRPVSVIKGISLAYLGGHPTPKFINGKLQMDYTWLFFPQVYRDSFVNATMMFVRGKYQEALEGYNKCLELTRDKSNTYYAKSLCFKNIGDDVKYKENLQLLESTPLEYLMKKQNQDIKKN